MCLRFRFDFFKLYIFTVVGSDGIFLIYGNIALLLLRKVLLLPVLLVHALLHFFQIVFKPADATEEGENKIHHQPIQNIDEYNLRRKFYQIHIAQK